MTISHEQCCYVEVKELLTLRKLTMICHPFLSIDTNIQYHIRTIQHGILAIGCHDIN